MMAHRVVPLLLGAAITVAIAAPAGADPTFVGTAVGYQIGGIPKGSSYVSSTATGAKQGALQSCNAQLSACAPAGTSTQCLGIATGVGTHWESAEGPDKRTAEANARAKLLALVAGLPLPDTHGAVSATSTCSWDVS